MAKHRKIYLRDIQAAMKATDIHDAIDQWHSMGEDHLCYGLTLPEYLGLTRDEYNRWVETGELPENCPWY